jgi:tetratricopeptide (TPR) repeat protein
VRSKPGQLAVLLAVLWLAGALLNRWAAPAWSAARARQPALQLDASLTAAGQGATLALLGGFRALVADATWIKMYTAWEQRDLPATHTLLQLVTTLDPRPVYFWLNGARIMAYDFTAWRVRAAGGREQGALALAHLDRAMQVHPASADLWIERANIQLNRLQDVAGAAESYRRAWEQPNAPYYAARLHAELLRRLGRKEEALAWLVQLHPRLPAGDEAAARDVVLARIRELEQQLKVPVMRAYRPAP